MMNFNPHRLGHTPSVNVSAGDISQFLQGGQQSIGNAIESLRRIGELDRTKTVSDLISSGGLNNLSESQAQNKILELTGGQSTTKDLQNAVGTLLSGKRSNAEQKFKTSERKSEQDFRKDKRIAEQLFKSQQSEAQNKQALDRLINDQRFRRDERLGSQDFQLKLAQARALASQGKEDTFGKEIAIGLAEDIRKSPNYVDEQVAKVEALFDSDNILWDAELDSEKDKAVVRQAIRDSLFDKKGKVKLALKDKSSMFDAVKEELKKKNLDLSEDFFGNISIIKTKK